MTSPLDAPSLNLRDLLGRVKAGIALPRWLADGYPESPSFGFRVLWTVAYLVDGLAVEASLQGALAGVGRGIGTSLDLVGDARGLIRNQGESAEDYTVRLRTWIDRAKENGTVRRLALAIHDYLESKPVVRVFRRNGACLSVAADGTITETVEAWDWDSVSHPERAGFWSDLWIVVYTRHGAGPIQQWPHRPGTFGALTGDDGHGIGHLASKSEIDAVKGLVLLCKAAHSCVRAVIWTSDVTRFVPGNPASMPNGTWGGWSMNVAGSQVLSGRDLTTCRYWEPR